MKWRAQIQAPVHIRAVIEKEQLYDLNNNTYIDTYYLYVYEGNNTQCTWDHMQDTLEIAMKQGWEDFNIPMSAWQKIEE